MYHFCAADENECEAGNPCSHACHNVMGTYYCSCPRGLTISADGRTCQGIQLPSESVLSAWLLHSQVIVLNDSMLFILVDIDECSLGENVCNDGQDCENIIGSYRCVMRCGRGFRRTADGLSCTGTLTSFNDKLNICCEWYWFESKCFFSSCSDVNECQESNPCNQHCLNTIGSYRCACEPGFQLRNRRCIGETPTPLCVMLHLYKS